MNLRRNSRLSTFLLVAFGWSWAWDAAYYWFGWWGTVPTTFPRQWGVPLGAVAVVWASDVPLRSWLDRVGRWRLHPVLYLLALAVPLAITNGQQVVRALGGGSLAYAPPAGLGVVVLFVLANAVLLGGVEEFGWRGVVQPRLQERVSVVSAGLAVGALWWAWHLPLFLGHPNFPVEPTFVLQYTAFVLGASVVFGAYVNVTGGSVLPLMVMHATTNLGPLLAGSGGPLADSSLVPLFVGSGAWWLVAAVLVAAFGRSMAPDRLVPSG